MRIGRSIMDIYEIPKSFNLAGTNGNNIISMFYFEEYKDGVYKFYSADKETGKKADYIGRYKVREFKGIGSSFKIVYFKTNNKTNW